MVVERAASARHLERQRPIGSDHAVSQRVLRDSPVEQLAIVRGYPRRRDAESRPIRMIISLVFLLSDRTDGSRNPIEPEFYHRASGDVAQAPRVAQFSVL